MRKSHEYLSKKTFDIYQLQLFRLVAESKGFTRAAQITGLTQSAMTRQIQNMEQHLEVSLFKRTTRQVSLTAAGQFLFQESTPLLGDVDSLVRRLREEYAEVPREVRVGVSRSVSLAYLPGFFSSPGRQGPLVISRVSHDSSAKLLELLESNELDVAVLFPPARLSGRLRITHRFRDGFTFIAHADQIQRTQTTSGQSFPTKKWLEVQPWLALQETTQTGLRIAKWLKQQKIEVNPSMQLDNFDLIINLVALGLGISLVPKRALALYGRRRSLVRFPWPKAFERELVVVVRKQTTTPPHIQKFVENILF